VKKLLVLGGVLLLLAGGASAQSLSGQWSAEMEFDFTQATFSDALTFYNTLIAQYAVGGWTFGSLSTFADTGWSAQLLTAAGVLGAYSFDTSLSLGTEGTFQSWVTTVGTSMGGMTFGITTTLNANGLGVQLSLSGSTDLVEFDGGVSFGDPSTSDCDLYWQGISIDLEFPFCCADLTLEIDFDCDGFDSLEISVVNLTISSIPWLSLDASLKFQLESKTLVLAPDFDFGEVSCDFDLYMDVTSVLGGEGPNEPLWISQSIQIDGIKLACSVDGIQFLGVSYWGSGSKPSILAGTDYWEGYQISTVDDGCCGAFAFDVAVFFDEESTALLDIAAFEATVELDVSEQFTFSSEFNVDVLTSTSTWSVGFSIVW